MDIYPVTFEPVTNRESWSQLLKLTDVDTGDALDLDALVFACEVRRTGQGASSGFNSADYYDPLVPYGSPAIKLSLGDGITVIDTGEVEISLTETQMRTLAPDTYSIAMTAGSGDGTDTRQVFLGRLPVLYGGVT